MPLHLILALVLIAAAYIFSDWRNWRLYYSTMLFWAMGDLTYRFLFDDKPLWVHRSMIFTIKQVEFVWILAIYPSTLLLFFTYYLKQKSLKNRILYIFLWAAVYSVLEFIFHKYENIVYTNGWNYYYSMIFYFVMFPILTLHHFKPLWAVLVSMLCTLALMYVFLGTMII